MVRRDFVFLQHYFRKELMDESNDEKTVLRMIINLMLMINQSHTNFNPQIFWEGATKKEIPPIFETLFPGAKFSTEKDFISDKHSSGKYNV